MQLFVGQHNILIAAAVWHLHVYLGALDGYANPVLGYYTAFQINSFHIVRSSLVNEIIEFCFRHVQWTVTPCFTSSTTSATYESTKKASIGTYT
jgi:hypothetical protein